MRLYPNLALLIFAFLLSSLTANALTAGFTPSATSGCPPLVVTFTNTSTGWTSGTWNFGTGAPTVPCLPGDPPAGTSFTSPGTYTVTLTVTDGATTSTSTTVITVYPLPTTDFTAVDTSVCPGSPVSFINTTSGPGSPFTYTWNFGDGNTSSATSPTHTYAAPGYYNITLSATNAQGCTKTITKTAFVHVFNPPIADFISSPTSYCTVPVTVSFTNLTSGTAPFTTSWSFGDGGTSSTGSHTYTSTGSYNVTLIVTDANGCSDTITKPSYINISNPTASFTGPTTACVGSLVNFTNTSPSSVSENWAFGDGGTASVGSHTYSSPGTYTVTLTIFDGICSATVTHTIVILPLPPVTIAVNPTAPCPPPATLTLTATVPAGSTVLWSYGDGGTGSGSSSTHTYGSPGSYTITATVTDANGCVNTATQIITLYDLHASVSASAYSGCAPLTVTFTPSVYTLIGGVTTPYPYVPASYSWGFGDGGSGGPGSGPTSHTYTAPGTYVCTVTATTANGCVVTETQTIIVGTPPVATFSAVPTHICYSDSVVFTPILITGPVDNYRWIFGDGGSASSVGSYVYRYTLPGVFTVTMVPIYHGCPGDTVVFTNYVTVDSPKAIITRFYSCTNKRAVKFDNTSMGATSWTWDFGDGSPTSSADTITHIYPALGTYTARLVTHNATSGCRDTTYENINLFDLSPDFNGFPPNICRDDSVRYTASVTGGVPNDYMWYVGSVHLILWDGSPTSSYTFNTTGLYTVTLVTRDGHDCLDTMVKTNYTRVAKPDADFTTPSVDACWGVPFTFTDASTDVSGAAPFSHYWDFGDGFTTTTSSGSIGHTYSTGGTFTVLEIVTDVFGCKDTIVKPSYINVHKPVPSFTPSTVTPCLDVPFNFTNTSSGGAISSSWTFGDGNTSTATSPTHTYSVIGVYDVKLVVTDAFGCKDSLVNTAYMNVTRPDAAFSMSDSFSVCPPLSVNFVSGSTGATSLAWTFGDGNSATTPSPTNMYISAGYYTVQLVVTNAYGCKDTATRHVNVYGYAGAFSYSPLSGCRPLRVFFNASVTNVTSLTWDFQDGSVVSSGTSDTISHVYTIPGAYIPKLILSDNTGCQNSSIGIDTIKVDGIITKFTTFPDPVCQNVSFNFIDSSKTYWSPITSRTWYYDGNVSTSSSPSYSYAIAGTYPIKLVVTNGWGCIDSVQANVKVNPPPAITTSPDTVVCVTDPATLYGYGGVSYTWEPPATLSCTSCNPTNATPTEVTVYTVTGTDANGCVNTDTVRVGLRTHTISNGWGDTAVCRGVPVPLFDTGGTKYTWAPGWLSNSHISNPIATPPSTQTYTVIAQLASCIPDTNYVTVVIYQPPTVYAGEDQRVLAGTIVGLDAEGTLIADQKWVPDAQLTNDTGLHTSAEMERSTTFYIDVVSNHGCRASDSVRVLVYCDNSQIFIPNSFTPNGDGENDVFYPRGKGVKAINSFRIYNRWGQLVYDRPHIQLNDPTFGWNGTFNGDKAHPDVYVYFIEAVCYTGEPIFIKGDITILK